MGKKKVDHGTIAGLLIAASGVIAGLLLDGGSLHQVLQPTAALIVLGGTLGAVLIQFPLQTVQDALIESHLALFTVNGGAEDHIKELAHWCFQARRHGLLALDAQLDQIKDRFLSRSLMLAVDAVPLTQLRETMEVELYLEEERDESLVRVLEAAGGFAPTLGIVGAVLGLIQVMQRMDDVAGIGKGIAVAFVSTLYGIGFANLLFLPIAGRLRIRMRERQMMRELTLDAVISIAEGMSVRALRERLQGYLATSRAAAKLPQEQELAIP